MARGRTTRDMSDTGPLDLTEAFDIKPWSKSFGADGAATVCCPDCVYGPVITTFKTRAKKCQHGRYGLCKLCERSCR